MMPADKDQFASKLRLQRTSCAKGRHSPDQRRSNQLPPIPLRQGVAVSPRRAVGGEDRGEGNQDSRRLPGCSPPDAPARTHPASERSGFIGSSGFFSVTRHGDSAWYQQLLGILWHLNSNRGADDSAFACTPRSIEMLFFKTCRTSPRAVGSHRSRTGLERTIPVNPGELPASPHIWAQGPPNRLARQLGNSVAERSISWNPLRRSNGGAPSMGPLRMRLSASTLSLWRNLPLSASGLSRVGAAGATCVYCLRRTIAITVIITERTKRARN